MPENLEFWWVKKWEMDVVVKVEGRPGFGEVRRHKRIEYPPCSSFFVLQINSVSCLSPDFGFILLIGSPCIFG